MKIRIAFYACLIAGLALFAGLRTAAPMAALILVSNVILDGLFGHRRLWRTAGQSLAIRSLLGLGFLPLAWLVCRLVSGRGALILLGTVMAAGLAVSLRRKKAPVDPSGSDIRAIVAILVLVVVLTWIPFSRIGSPVDGQYAYRAYFSSDYLKHFATVEALRAGPLPPPNLYFKGESLHYYWLPYVVPAVVSKIAGSTPRAMFGFSFCVNYLFLLLLFFAAQAACRRRKSVPYIVLISLLAPSLEGFYLWAAKARFSLGSYLATAAGYNVDGLTRWIWGLPQIDTVLRSMLFTPQHLLSLAYVLLFLFLLDDEQNNAAALSLSLGLSFAASFFIGGFCLMVWGPYALVREIALVTGRRKKPWDSLRLMARLFAFPVFMIGSALALRMMTPGANTFVLQGLAPGRAAIEVGLNFGFLAVAGLAGLAAARFPGRGFNGLLLAVALGFILFIRIANFESDLSLKLGLIAGLILALSLARLGNLPGAGRFVWLWGILIVFPGLFTLAADVRNSADVHNRRFTSYVSADEAKLLQWARTNVPPSKTVQNYPEGRTWNLSTIPALAGRQMVVGDRSHGQIFQIRPDLYERRLEALRRALAGLPATQDDLARLGVDYLFWGEDERRAFPIEPGLPVAFRAGDVILYYTGRN